MRLSQAEARQRLGNIRYRPDATCTMEWWDGNRRLAYEATPETASTPREIAVTCRLVFEPHTTADEQDRILLGYALLVAQGLADPLAEQCAQLSGYQVGY